MCGIFGFVDQSATIDVETALRLVKRLCLYSETRGKDVSGLLVLDDSFLTILKQTIRARDLLRLKEFKRVWSALVRGLVSRRPYVVAGHTRMVTNGDPGIHENNQPATKHGMACIHNGIVVNDGEIWDRFPELSREQQLDTEVILALLHRYRRRGQSLAQAVQSAYAQVLGANSIAVFADDLDSAVLASANGSLFYANSDNGLVFASEKYILQRVLADKSASTLFGKDIIQLRSGRGLLLDWSAGEMQIREGSLSVDSPPFGDFADKQRERKRQLVDLLPTGQHDAPTLAVSRLRELERLCVANETAIADLKRCSRCLLPETFPFITFDENHACTFCRQHEPRVWQGRDALEDILDLLRRSDNEPDCLVPLSGGRDSTYALHFIKEELGMNPVAYTYDWGMVTDLARRNISRICGALGVEHILISADIRSKRANIRKNVLAWLKRPSLGTVPLFMAGDKHFFYFARMLRQQMGLNATIFGMNPLERTDFKVGFCGINEVESKEEKHYDLSILNKARIMSYYAKEFVLNPAYLNSTLYDTFAGFFSYYWLPRDYMSLFDYIRWDEDEVERTILDGYDWETASDTPSTWRIGDGTASFYNYIYYRIAGFSENDTFRSNQVREGMLTRDEAWAIVSRDNRPRIESIQWYCDTIGVDPSDAVRQINAVPTLYGGQR